MSPRPYRSAPAYFKAGYGPLRLPARKKAPPPDGYTGRNGHEVTAEDVERWVTESPSGNIGLLLPRGVIGIDVDSYKGANHVAAWNELTERCGPLPDAPWCSSRDDGVSGVRLFRVPENWEAAGKLPEGSNGISPGEVIQWHHRYVVAPPSIHPDTRRAYRWRSGSITNVADLPVLPQPWLDALSSPAVPVRQPARPPTAPRTGDPAADRPGDAFNEHADWMADILGPHGWELHHESGGTLYVTRPGKSTRDGHSATIGHSKDGVQRLYVFSADAAPFELETPYSKFSAHALLNHGGDHQAAARELARRGYGAQRPPVPAHPAGQVRNEPPEMGPHPAGQPQTDGSSALAPVVKIGKRRDSDAPSWDKPFPLGTRHVLPPFPVDALPEWVGNMVAGVAVETQTPPDIPGTIALATLSAAAGGRIAVSVRDGWEEPANLYGAAVAEPGTRKSAVYRALTAPLYAAERVLNEAVAQERYEREAERVRLEEAEKISRDKLLRDNSPEALKAAADAARELEEFRIPQPLQLVTGDISPEECISILDAQSGRLAVLSAEGRVFDIITGRYSNGEPCLSPFLEGHAGDPLRVNRRGRYEYIERPALTIGVCIQPTVLQWIASKPRLRGQGLLARFLYSVPPDLVGYRASEPPAIDAGVRSTYEGNLKAMVLSLSEWDEPMVLLLTDAARKVVIDYLEVIEPRLRPDGDLYGVRDWAAKLAGAVVRLAALMHTAGHLRYGYLQPVTENTLRQAIQLGDYYTTHALAAFGAMTGTRYLGLAGAILGWLYPEGSREHHGEFSKRDAHRQFQEREGHATTAEDIAGTLQLLETHGYIRPIPAPPRFGKGRPPAPRYEVCPTAPDGTDRRPKRAYDQRLCHLTEMLTKT